jgi:tRNA pseudouridine55 synthase
MDGILNICKPTGISSFKALSIVKRRLYDQFPEPKPKFKNWRVGHLGTLDPAACGVLVLLFGKATKLFDKLSGRGVCKRVCDSKVYQSTFTFGIETDTLDSEGEVIARSDIIPTAQQIRPILPTGDIEIEVPKFSAVHINGKRAYDLARKGIDFTPPTKTVTIHRFEVLKQISDTEFFFEIECETGTYIRSLAKLLAQKLGTVAIASTITRTRVGEFRIEDAKNLQEVDLCDIIQI